MGKFKFFTVVTIVSTLLFLTFISSYSTVHAESVERAYLSNELIVQFKDDKKDFNSQKEVTISASFPELGLALIKVPEDKLEEYKKSLANDVNVESVQYNYIYKSLNLIENDNISNDPLSNWQWGLHNIGQTIQGSQGQIDVDINLPEAWKLIENKKEKLAEVVVAVLDDGVQTQHPDLKSFIWINTREIAGNNKDDDNNGYNDDINGWDFYNGKNSVVDNKDDGLHGTHLAGTIAATANNEVGISGIAPNVKLMPLKFINGNEGGNVWDAIEGIRYAENHGAKIVIASWGSKHHSPALEQAIEASKMLFVTAAGNEKNDNDGATKNYPSSLDSSNIISVGAVDKNGERAGFSNYGAKSVDLVAPGVSIYSTVPNDGYGFSEGTSMAAAHVAGVAALLAGVEEKITPEEIKQVLTVTGKKANGAKNTVSGKMLDAKSALAYYIVSLPLKIDPVYDSSRYITGSTEPEALVIVESKSGKVIEGQADVHGKFQILLPKRQPTNTELVIYSKKGLINSLEVPIKVLHDNVKPILVEGSLDITDKSEKLEGKVSEFVNVYIKIADQVFSGATKEDGTFSFDIKPLTIGTKGEYILTDLADPSNTTTGSFVVKDHVAPYLLVNPIVTDQTTVVEGQVSKQATVQLKVGNKVLSNPVQTNESGEFEISISKQKMGTEITIIMADDWGQTREQKIVVKDGTGPVISKLSTVFETSHYVEGYVNEASTITIHKLVDGEWVLLKDKLSASDNEPFTFELSSKLAVGNKIKIVAEDAFENKSKETILTVQQDRTAPKLVDPKKIIIDDSGETVITGKLSEEGTVDVLVGTKSILDEKVTTDKNGIFTVKIPQRQAKEKLTFVFEDTKPTKPNTSKVTVTVTDETAPEFVGQVNVFNTSRVITGVISEAAKVTAKIEGKTLTSPTAKWDEGEKGYVFTITMKEHQKVGAKIELQAVDSHKNESAILEVIVQDDTSPLQLDGELIITDAQTSVKGKIKREGTVQLFAGDEPLHKSPVKTDAAGNFRVSIKKQKAGTVITVKMKDYVNQEEEAKVTVDDKTNPVVSKVDTVYHTSKFITGEISEWSTVTIKGNGIEITEETDANGAFSISLTDELATGDKLIIEAVDLKGLPSKQKSVTVRKDTAAPKLVSTEEILVNTKEIKGKLNETGKLSVSSKGLPTIGFFNTEDDGTFAIPLSDSWSLTKGQTITITAEDVVGNKKNYKVKVK